MRKKAVFIDRDGTININVEYLDNPDNFKMYPGVAEGIKLLNKNGFLVIVVTNQSGIARGFFTEDVLKKIHKKMIDDFSKKGAKIDAIYYCPHHPDDNCDCRKPKIGLFKKAFEKFDIDASKSFMIGDRVLDVEAGFNMGLKTVIVPEKKKAVSKEMKKSDVTPDFYCNEFIEGVKWILDNT